MKMSSLSRPLRALTRSDQGAIRVLCFTQALALLHGGECMTIRWKRPDRLAAPARSAGFQLDTSMLLGREAEGSPPIVSVMSQEVPGQHCQPAGHRDDGDLRSSTSAYALMECSERSRKANGGVGSFYQQAARMRLPLSADVASMSRSAPRLPHSRIETEVADQVGRTREPCDIADHGDHGDGGDQADPRGGHQAQHTVVLEGRLGQVRFGRPDLSLDTIQQSEGTLDLGPFIDRQGDCFEPAPTRLAEQVAERMCDEVTLQGRAPGSGDARLLSPAPLPGGRRGGGDARSNGALHPPAGACRHTRPAGCGLER